MIDQFEPVAAALRKAQVCLNDRRPWRAIQFASLAMEAAVINAPHLQLDPSELAKLTARALGPNLVNGTLEALADEYARTLRMICVYGENAGTLFGLAWRNQSLVEALDTQQIIRETEQSAVDFDSFPDLLACAGTHLRLKHRALLQHYERHMVVTQDAALLQVEADLASGKRGLEACITHYGPDLAYLAVGRAVAPEAMNGSTRFMNGACMLNAVKAEAVVLAVDGESAKVVPYDILFDVPADDRREFIEPVVIMPDRSRAIHYRLQVLDSFAGPDGLLARRALGDTEVIEVGSSICAPSLQ